MAHFARLNNENEVVEVVGLNNRYMKDADGNESEAVGVAYLNARVQEANWKQTSYNTCAGVHKLGGTPLRGNYCGKGWVYSEEHDIFHSSQPYPSWTLETVKGYWEPPVPMPEREDNEFYAWNEDEQQWDLVVQ